MIALVGWDLSDIELEVAEKIKAYILTTINIETAIIDAYRLNPVDSSWEAYIVFGSVPTSYILATKDKLYHAPALQSMIDDSEESTANKIKVQELVEQIVNKLETSKSAEAYVETQEGISIGRDRIIDISDDEIEHLKKIKDLLGGGTIVIKKGEYEIRIENE